MKETAERVQQTAGQTTCSLVFLKHEVQQKEWDERTGEVRPLRSPALACCVLQIPSVFSVTSAATLLSPGPVPIPL